MPDFCEGAFGALFRRLSHGLSQSICTGCKVLFFDAFILFLVNLNKLYIQTSAVKLTVYFY